MKKTVSLFLVALLLCALSIPVLADHAYTLEDWGLTITLPDNVSAEDASTDEVSQLLITVDGREDLAYLMQFFYDENYEGRTFADLSQDELQALADGFAEVIVEPTVSQQTIDGFTFLTVDSSDGTQGAILMVDDGYVINVIVGKDGEALTEDEAVLAFALLTTMSFSEEEPAA